MTDTPHPHPTGDAATTLESAVVAFLAAYDEPKAQWADVEGLVPALRAALASRSSAAAVSPESANDRYERRAAAFYEATGMMAPGKDVPAACGADDYEARLYAWRNWLAENPDPSPAAVPPTHVLTDAERAEADRFWMEVAERNPDRLNVRAELQDYHFILDQVPKVYMHVTGGRLSKPNYYAHAVIGVADEHIEKLCDEAAEESAAAVPVPGDGGEDEPEAGVQDWIAQLRDDAGYLDLNGGRYRLLDVAAGADLAGLLEFLASRLSSVGASADTERLDWLQARLASDAVSSRALLGDTRWTNFRAAIDAARAALSQEARP